MRLGNKTEVLRQMCCGSLPNKEKYFFCMCVRKQSREHAGRQEQAVFLLVT